MIRLCVKVIGARGLRAVGSSAGFRLLGKLASCKLQWGAVCSGVLRGNEVLPKCDAERLRWALNAASASCF